MNLMLFIVAAALGGFIRFALEYYLPPVGSSAFPRATWLVNVVGAFLLGMVLALPGEWQVILGIGLCGALTTFSGVSLQLHRRLMAQAFKPAMIYAVTLLSGGIVAAGVGLILGRYIFS
jgi:fluoride exporter